MVAVDPYAAVSRPKYMVISFDDKPKIVAPRAQHVAKGDTTGMSGGKDDHV